MAKRLQNQVRALRESRGLSQVALTEAARLTRQSVGAIETGRATPAVDVALRVAQALDCRVEDLFTQPAAESVSAEPASSAVGPRVALARVALAFGLEFLPLSAERYDLVVPVAELNDLRVRRLLDEVAFGAFRRELESLGYDASRSGDRVTDLSA